MFFLFLVKKYNPLLILIVLLFIYSKGQANELIYDKNIGKEVYVSHVYINVGTILYGKENVFELTSNSNSTKKNKKRKTWKDKSLGISKKNKRLEQYPSKNQVLPHIASGTSNSQFEILTFQMLDF